MFFNHLITLIVDDPELFMVASVCCSLNDQFDESETLLMMAKSMLGGNEKPETSNKMSDSHEAIESILSSSKLKNRTKTEDVRVMFCQGKE